jgi:ATP-binding cassette subfamily F protein 3
VYFIRALANHVVHVNAGQLTRYPGGYQYYLDKTKAQSERAALISTGRDGVSPSQNKKSGAAASRPSLDRKDQKRLEAERRQARSRGRKAQQEIVSRLEAEIFKLETRLGELTMELENPATYEEPGHAAQVNRELLHAQERLAQLNPEWEAEAGKLSAMN